MKKWLYVIIMFLALAPGLTHAQPVGHRRHHFRRHHHHHIRRHIRPSGYWAWFDTTAYCLTGTTASGYSVGWGVVAATLPFGTHLSIPGYGYATVLDRGVGPGALDLWMPSCSEALQWGRRWEKVFVYY